MAGRKGKQRKREGSDIAAPGLDDALSFLIQIDPGKPKGFSRLSEILAVILSGQSLNATAVKSVIAAKDWVDRLIRGESSDGEEVLIETSRLLEAASNCTGIGTFQEEPTPGVHQKPDSVSAGLTGSIPPPDVLPSDIDADLVTEFVLESCELLDRAEAALLSLESNPDDAEAVNTVFRAFHTIKGTSGFIGLKLISDLSHLAESLLSRVRNREIRLTDGYADLALRSTDVLKKAMNSLRGAKGGALLEIPEGFENLISALSQPDAGVPSAAELPANQHESEREELRAGRQDAAAMQQTKSSKAEYDSSIRVNTARLDTLIDLVGELVIAQSMVVQDERLSEDDCHELLRKVTQAGKIIRELHDLSLSMRMVPLRGTFQRMQRVVRDLARKTGKEITLVMDDGGTEIDRRMVAILNEVLVHMIRNAIDHGIETPEDREKCGKPRHGTIWITASYSGGTVVVEIRDDGKGLDRERILRKAVSAGIVDSGKTLSDSEVFSLVFAPGLSTSDQVTDLSGRGVGMDVVRRGVASLNGRVEIVSTTGLGSTFTVRLPLTLAVTDGMLVKVGTERYIIPTISIHLCFRPDPGCLSTVTGRGELVVLRGEMMPIFRLHRLFGIRSAVENPSHGLLVIVGEKDRRCAILVDELLGQQQVVARSLNKAVGKIPGISGGAILGDGKVGLILDTAELCHLAG